MPSAALALTANGTARFTLVTAADAHEPPWSSGIDSDTYLRRNAAAVH
jgi:hypothetical protein